MESREEKIGRTVKLNKSMNDRLVALCEHIGVNVNSYLLNEIGKSVSRDELAYLASKNVTKSNSAVSNMNDGLVEIMNSVKGMIDDKD
jgi:hypothetical protein